MRYDTDLWRGFVRIIRADIAYSRSRQWSRLLLASEEPRRVLPASEAPEPTTWGDFDVVAEHAFNKTIPGFDDIAAIQTLERSVWLLDIAAFNAMVSEREAAFEALEWRAKSPQVPAFWRTFDKAVGQLNGLKGIRARLADIKVDIPTKSTYYKGLNGRIYARHFGLGEVPAEWRRRIFRDRRGMPLVGADISSSWLQILAEFTSDEPLRAMLDGDPFKVQAAEIVWARHRRSSDPFELSDGYTGPDDERLQALCKFAPMTALYGSPLTEIADRLGEEPEDYGPGLPVAMLKLLLRDPDLRLSGILDWYLPALKRVAWRSWQADPYEGIAIVDGDSIQQWNHIRTKTMKGAGDSHHTIYIDVPVAQELVHDDEGTHHEYRPLTPRSDGQYESNVYKLQQVAPPCFVHRMDGVSNKIIVNDLSARGVEDVGAIHDCWIVGEDREADLHDAISAMGRPWLESRGPDHELLAKHLGTDKKFGPWVRGIREAWESRVSRSDWPEFKWSPAK